jgi:trans-aconitate methyltransferase
MTAADDSGPSERKQQITDEPILEDPTNRIVCVFDSQDNADAACEELTKIGIKNEQVRRFRGAEDAENVDSSAKWFADTDKLIKRYKQQLRLGSIVISVPVKDSDDRDRLHALLNRCDARLITHFGEWITEVMR